MSTIWLDVPRVVRYMITEVSGEHMGTVFEEHSFLYPDYWGARLFETSVNVYQTK
jgi:hypothetical protein